MRSAGVRGARPLSGVQQRFEFARLVLLSNNVAAANELAIDEELRYERPVPAPTACAP
jgi:hypothetical protein